MQKAIELKNKFMLIISRAQVHDASQIIDFLNSAAGETDYLTFGANEFPFSIQEEEEIIKECLEKNLCLMLIGKIKEEIGAQLFLQRSSKPRVAHVGDIGISVAKKYWGLSIGKQMMLAAIEWAKNNGITKLQLQVRTDNERAVHLYKKLGFVIEGTLTRVIKIDGAYFDEYLMGMQIVQNDF